MAVVTQYVVVRDGEEKMTFATKAEADAHDKMLDMVDELLPLLERSETITDEKQIEDLAFFLAREREQVLMALGAKRPAKKKATKSAEVAKNEKAAEDEAA
ncbi:YebG family protein [Pseudidiomarina sp. CB1]|uniref:YebG family protein n=1 Tax=Pseudidiomarina sp. CB1 TaxID=2972484 RepID=UPI0021623C28|nr:YebG family protein [Pseudidiomarina sp. CB1]